MVSVLHPQQFETRLQLLADTVPGLVLFVGPDRKIGMANHACRNWFGIENPSGLDLVEVIGDNATSMLASNIETAFAGGSAGHDIVLSDREDNLRNFRANSVPHVADGDVLGFYLLMVETPLSPNNTGTQDKQQARQAYVQRMTTIGQMASTLGHDLKQPLAAINTYADALRRMVQAGKPAEHTTSVLKKLADQTRRATDIVDDIRDFVGNREADWQRVDVDELVQGATRLISGRIHATGVELKISEQPSRAVVHGDKVQIEQVVINLINNAIDAMDDSRPRRLRLTTHRPDAYCVQIDVTDSGPGLAANQLEAVFGSFHSSKPNGMGMGLAISRSIAEWHGGRLWAQSEADYGATFCLSLPVAGPESGPY